jgi:GNAT superfamily N-acetyltransferase
MVILGQSDSRLTHNQPTAQQWIEQARSLIADPNAVVLVAMPDSGTPAGYVIGAVDDAQRGLIRDIALDAHRYHAGLGRRLVTTVRGWFADHEAAPVLVNVPRFHAVEQAFWRALGAREWKDDQPCRTAARQWMVL